MTKIKLFFVFFLLNNNYLPGHSIQCLDDDNKPVDWFVLYKLPRLKQDNKLIQAGLGYVYMTSEYYTSWKLSQYSINESVSMVGNTLKPLYTQKKNDLAYILYNDEVPNGPVSFTKGHTKGLVLANSTEGFWLIHSVPKFPDIKAKYEYPSTGTKYGQSFLCISLDLKSLDEVGIQLQYNEPFIYSSNIPNSFESQIQQIAKAAMNVTVQQPPWYSMKLIQTKAGVSFGSFAKSGRFAKDLYADLVAPALESNLLVESWPNGRGKMPSDCTKPRKVYNVESIEIVSANASFATTHDHSKWAVSDAGKFICIGDINRMEEQKNRGGGTVCFKNNTLAGDYHLIVTTIEKCK